MNQYSLNFPLDWQTSREDELHDADDDDVRLMKLARNTDEIGRA